VVSACQASSAQLGALGWSLVDLFIADRRPAGRRLPVGIQNALEVKLRDLGSALYTVS